MTTKTFALILAGLILSGCVANDDVRMTQEREQVLDQDLDGDGMPID